MRHRGTRPLLLSLLLAVSSCGREERNSEGAKPAARPPLHLVVEGTDREMGLEHGKALAREIAEETGPRLRARFAAVAADAAEAKFLEDACRLYTRKVKPLLPSEVRDELSAIAEGSGVPEDSILLLEVMREGLRFHLDRPPLVEAALASPPGPWAFGVALRPGQALPEAPLAVYAAWDGAGGADLTGHALILERRPAGRSATLVVTWAGGLGALAGVSAAKILVAEGEVSRDRKEEQSLNGVPFSIALRTSLERARTIPDFFDAIPALSANRVLASQVPRTDVDQGLARRLALKARVGANAQDFGGSAWVLAPAGPGGNDRRASAMDAQLAAYPQRPGPSEALRLAVSGRSSSAGAVLELTLSGITWKTGIGPDGKPGPGSQDLSFDLGPAPK